VSGTATGDGVAVSDPGDRFEREAESRATEVTAQRQGEEEEEEPEGLVARQAEEMEEEEEPEPIV
jgi:hypothetical protein